MEKISSKSFSKQLSKYSHNLFQISRQPNIDSENSSIECKQGIEKLLDSENVQTTFFTQMTLQMMIQSVKLKKTLGDEVSRLIAQLHLITIGYSVIIAREHLVILCSKRLLPNWIKNATPYVGTADSDNQTQGRMVITENLCIVC